MKRSLLWFVIAAAGVAGGAAVYAVAHAPEARKTNGLKIEPTAERLERGKYLAESALGCLFCHTRRDPTIRTRPPIGPEGAGGECFGEDFGIPGQVCTPNITPDFGTGLGAWTDDEILRAMREGVGRDGRALFPMMPYEEYRYVADEDAYAVVVYLRALEPVRNEVPAPKIGFPVNLLIKRVPKPVLEPVTAPDPGDGLVRYGGHIAMVYGCTSCHGSNLAGGSPYPVPGGIVRSANLTPDETGIVPADVDDFVRIFRGYAGDGLPEGANEQDLTFMPWADFAGLSDLDLRALHAYLRNLPPVRNQVQTYSRTLSG